MARNGVGGDTALTLIAAMAVLAGCTQQKLSRFDSTPPPVMEQEGAPFERGPLLPPAPPPPSAPVLGNQYLFGSAEASVITTQTYDQLVGYALPLARKRPKNSVVLVDGSRLDTPSFVPCGKKPLAVVFDADETLIWNIGSMRWFSERRIGFDKQVWDQWEKTGAGKAVAIPGAIEGVNALRQAGITVVANTNRSAENATGTEETLRAAGLGEFKHGDTLFLMGDDAGGSSKDMRRATISSRYCVIAMVGDQLGDFSQQYNVKDLPAYQRNAYATTPAIRALWGKGWFLLPNPLYGPWEKLKADDIYPPHTEWEPK